MKEYNKPRQS